MRQPTQEVDLRLHLPTQEITYAHIRDATDELTSHNTSNQRGEGGRTAGTNMDMRAKQSTSKQRSH
jgi:hypothetical protein